MQGLFAVLLYQTASIRQHIDLYSSLQEQYGDDEVLFQAEVDKQLLNSYQFDQENRMIS